MNGVTIGTDFELMGYSVVDGYVPLCELIGGSKAVPRLCAGGNMQEDNVMAECAIDPVTSVTDFIKNIMDVRSELDKVLAPLDLSVKLVASAEFEPEKLAHPQAAMFGCDPDYNAWTLNRNPRPNAKTTLRSCGGHIHVGADDVKKDPIGLIRSMDLFLGIPSVLMDEDKRRRELYGKAGAFRHKPYGAEYRTLSNFWLASVELIHWAYNNTMKAVEFSRDAANVDSLDGDSICIAINTGDKDLAKELISSYGVALP